MNLDQGARVVRRRVRRAFSLVEILVVMAILAVMAYFLLPNIIGGAKNAADKKIHSPMKKAKGVECQSNLGQIRAALQMATAAGDETRPNSLADLRPQGVTDSMMQCPVGKTPYQFDAASQRVRCGYSGHESF